MRILLISPVGDQINGGIGKWTDHILSFYKDNPSEIALELLYNSNAKASFGTYSMLQRMRVGLDNYLPLYKGFCKKIKHQRYDVVHVCTSASISLIKDLAIVKKAHQNHIKTIVHCHFGRIPNILKSNNWESKLFKRLLNLVDQLVVMDMKSYEALRSIGYEKVSYLPNPLSLSVQKFIEENTDIKRIPNKIVFVGHVVVTKGVFELVEACKQLPNIDLRVLGHIPNKVVKEQLIEKAGFGYESWLHITGAVPFEEVLKEMLSCNVFVLPTYSEGFPNVIIESMACGCPIVTTPVGAIPEMLNISSNEPCGICVQAKSVEELLKAIQMMLNNKEQAGIFGKRAKDKVFSEYAMQNVWVQLKSIWVGVCKN